MAKIVMPKNSALLEEVESVLKIYYEEGGWLSNAEYRRRLEAMIGDGQYPSSYTKKAQITSYFGFTEWEDILNERSLRRITERGKAFYEHLVAKNMDAVNEDLLMALEKTTFGRNNFGCPASDSDVEPPVLFVRAIMDLGYLTYKEFAYLLWKLEDCGGNYTDSIREVKAWRSSMTFALPKDAEKYEDAKPIMVLIRWGFLAEDSTDTTGGKHIIINPYVRNKYEQRLRNLKIYNVDKDMCSADSDEQNVSQKTKEEFEIMVVTERMPSNFTIEELAKELKRMYDSAESKTTAIHMFGLKYAEIIKKNSYSTAAIIEAANLSSSYSTEIYKGIRIFESIAKNEYGIKFFDGEETAESVSETLPALPQRTRKRYAINAILYGAPGTGKTYATAQYAVAIAENKPLERVKSEVRADVMSRYNALVASGRIVFTTFHQNYGYEDFIQGIRPDTKSEGMNFKTEDGVFKEIADRAMRDPDKDYIIIIDEINRANISKVFGELITLIEDDKRWGEENAVSVTLPSGDIFAVPNNLYILGTMNSADKSISLIDTALRRRFDFVEHEPDAELIADPILREVCKRLNKRISDELGSNDLLIGHAYFMGKSDDDLCDVMNRNIIPLLYEYFFDNQKKVEAQVRAAVEGYNVEVKSGKVGRIKDVRKDEG